LPHAVPIHPRGMTARTEHEHFIPVRRSAVVERCVKALGGQGRDLSDVARLVSSILHFEFHARLERLKDLYEPMNPDSDTRSDRGFAVAPATEGQLVEELTALLERANYREVTSDELNRALNEESVFHVRLFTDLDDFERLILFRRGLRSADETFRRCFRRVVRRVDYYERVALYARFKPAEHFAAKGRERLPFTPGSTILKLFRNIPAADLEMLFPNADVRMRRRDQLVLGVPAIAGGIAVIVTKLGASLLLIILLVGYWLRLNATEPSIDAKQVTALGLGLLALCIHVSRQIGRFKNRKIQFMKALSDSLYYKNLDNNAGVFHRVIDEAEEEEGKEAILAYAHLVIAGRSMTSTELDHAIEAWLRDEFAAEADFEIEDALDKLHRLGLISRDGERIAAVALTEAKRRLDERWDGIFRFA
jgi:hypothetical protein